MVAGGVWDVFNASGAFSDGGFNATLTGITLVVNSNTGGIGAESVNIFSFASGTGDGLGFENNPALAGYGLVTPVGPLLGLSGNLTPTNGTGNFPTTGTTSVHLEQDVDNFLTFQATTVPEPATLTLVGLGLLAATRRRRKS